MNNSTVPSVVSKNRALSHYKWGNNCDAWSLVENETLCVKYERMPLGAEEELHYHKNAQQFFQILKGRAVFEVDEVVVIVHVGEGLQIEAGRKHRIINKDQEELEFIVVSQPSTQNDRYNIV